VLDVVGERGVGVVDDVDRITHVVGRLRVIFLEPSRELYVFVNETIFETSVPDGTDESSCLGRASIRTRREE